MASIHVDVCTIDEILEHSNSDNLEIAIIKGWQCCVKKSQYKVGDKVVYFEPDTMIPRKLAESIGVAGYLSFKHGEDMGRVRKIMLRGEPSFGLVIDAKPEWRVGKDVSDEFGAQKYDPPVRRDTGGVIESSPYFLNYTDIEDMRNYMDVFEKGEEVIATEKIHGTCCRIACIEGEYMAGSKGLQRQRPENDQFDTSMYWFPLARPNIKSMIDSLSKVFKHVMIFGEIFGKGVLDLHYGLKDKDFRVFDIMVDGKYMDYDAMLIACSSHNVGTVPLIYRGRFSIDRIKFLSGGKSIVDGAGDQIREGVVVRPIKERTHPKLGRVILKYVSDDYFFRKNAVDYKEE